MRNRISFLILLVPLCASSFADNRSVPDPKPQAAPIPEADKKLPQDNDYIVHEWGTFTSFSGSDGISLDFRPLVDEDLPLFVMDRRKQAFISERRDIAYRTGRGPKGLVISKQRMETPVTYFYSDNERIVDVTVEFPRGLLTEFYPPVRQFGPEYKKDAPEPLEKSWLRWGKIRLLPHRLAVNETGIVPFMMPVKPDEGAHYAYARETDSVYVQLSEPAEWTTYREKFLFYRGVGNFDLPVTLRSAGKDRFVVTHTGKPALRYAFLVQVQGKDVRYLKTDQLTGESIVALPQESRNADSLAKDMIQALVSDGLYEKEARAMVKTWQASWFNEQGTRLLYSLPQNYTDDLLPLRLSPAPREVTRVMIGRLEILTPETEKRIELLVSKLGAADPKLRERTANEIHSLGRFTEPALTRIAKLTDDPEIQARARSLLRAVLTGQAQDAPLDAKTPGER